MNQPDIYIYLLTQIIFYSQGFYCPVTNIGLGHRFGHHDGGINMIMP